MDWKLFLSPEQTDSFAGIPAEDSLSFQLRSAAAERRWGNTSTHSTTKQKNLQTFNQNRTVMDGFYVRLTDKQQKQQQQQLALF